MRTTTANGTTGSKWITRKRRLAIYLRDEFHCVYCGADLHQRTDITLDHLDTRDACLRRRRAGLPMHPSHRLVTACLACNSARQNQPWYRYATPEAAARITRLVRRVPNLKLAAAILRGDAEHANGLGWT